MSDAAHGTREHLVQMANDIGAFFRSEPDREVAIAAIANHINRYWTRRMRQKLLDQVQHGDAELDELPRAALGKVNTAAVDPLPPSADGAPKPVQS